MYNFESELAVLIGMVKTKRLRTYTEHEKYDYNDKAN